MKCFNQRRRKVKNFEWSYKHKVCIVCKTTDHAHHGKGYCEKCRRKHDVVYLANQIIHDKLKSMNIKKDKILFKKKADKDHKWRENNPKKKELYKATNRGLKGYSNNNKKRIENDIVIIKREIKRLENE